MGYGFRQSVMTYSLLGLFVLSGFAGLIYQAIWSHYLGLTLGHAAYAQTLVLAIFMGGMAIGAALASRYSLALRHLILAYAVIELLIGLAGLFFHPGFLAYTSFSQEHALPALGSNWAGMYQWLSAASLILPQCILLGATFPLLSAGYLRLTPADDARVLGGLYFSNSIGAALGALAATFLLLPAIGMPGAMAVAGWLNIAVAIGAALVWYALLPQIRLLPEPSAPVADKHAHDAVNAEGALFKLVIISTFLSGAFSFVYEIGWIRLLNQALGTTFHSFELMLAAFIFGLAFGGLWIRGRAEKIRSAINYVAMAQILMGVAALFSVVVFANSFGWVGWLIGSLQQNSQGYNLFVFGSAIISMLVMVPAAFFAGMTLPLFTMMLLRSGYSESSIGRVYAANTLGSIAGVLLAVHLLIPLLGVHLAIVVAAIGDIAIGLVLANRARAASGNEGLSPRLAAPAMFILILVIGASVVYGRPDPLQQAAGVFRTGVTRLKDDTIMAFLRDGKTATIAVYADAAGDYATITTNGKPDASLAIHASDLPLDDEITMLMAAALPLAMHPKPEQVAIIGWGSGLTTHTVLGSPAVANVDSIEIEREMWNGARLFGARVERAYEDPRSRIVFDDARTWFSTGNRRYDMIISEPSNPWVSGVANLFTIEFYRFLARHLNDGGMLVQWMQIYELSDPLLAEMTEALITVFPHVEVYTTNLGDLLFVSSLNQIDGIDMQRLSNEPLRSELNRVGLVTEGDFAVRYLGGRDMLAAFSELYETRAHSDFYPTVSLLAPRDRFSKRSATLLVDVFFSPIPVSEILFDKSAPAPKTEVSGIDVDMLAARGRAVSIVEGLAGQSINGISDAGLAGLMKLAMERPENDAGDFLWSDVVAELAAGTISVLGEEDLAPAWIHPGWLGESPSEFVLKVSAVYSALARRDVISAANDAYYLLENYSEKIAPNMREQLMVIGMLEAASRRDYGVVRKWEDTYASSEKDANKMLPVRSFLLAWADEKGK